MSLFQKIFGKKITQQEINPVSESHSRNDHDNDPNMIRVYDKYGRELFITKKQWKDNILIGNLEKERNNPEQLYDMLTVALNDGFAADVIPYAEHLWRIDPIPSRGAVMLGVVYMEVNRLDEAERILKGFLASHGEDGFVLTNLAKIASRRGDQNQAESLLWHALEVDPNQENGLAWYTSIQRDRDGENSALDAFRRVAALPKSWRAQLWLARDALQNGNLVDAENYYTQALTRVEPPIPTDLLMQMSGDFGNNGYLEEIIRFVEPYFDPDKHGIQVGNNLIKAKFDLEQLHEARNLLNKLYAQKRPDWHQTLNYWDTELTKADITKHKNIIPDQLSVLMESIEGPLWSRDGSPFQRILPVKHFGAPHFAILGGTVIPPKASEKPTLQLSDWPGRLSRAVPLILAEKIYILTDAVGIALIPFAQNQGFAIFENPYKDQDLCDLAGKSENPPDFVIGFTLDTSQSMWKFTLHVIQRTNGQRIGVVEEEATPMNLGPAVEQLFEKLQMILVANTKVKALLKPAWYQIPLRQDESDYLLRLEQQLALASVQFEFLKGGILSGEHEMLNGILQLCVRTPNNQTVRILLAQTLHLMRKVRPEIVLEYKEKILLLQHEHPLDGDLAPLIRSTIAKIVEE